MDGTVRLGLLSGRLEEPAEAGEEGLLDELLVLLDAGLLLYDGWLALAEEELVLELAGLLLLS